LKFLIIVVYWLITILVLNPYLYSVKGSSTSDSSPVKGKILVLCDKSPRTLCDRNGIAYQEYGAEIGIQLNPLRTRLLYGLPREWK
jgi:hypothetical protein